MKKICIILVVTIYSTTDLLSQTAQISTEPKTINYRKGAREVFIVCKGQPVKTLRDTLEYFWYNEQSGIKSTKGGSGGQLLHGKYQYFDEKGNLVKEANYNLGLEHGLSRTWEENGNIKETFKFNYGICTYLKTQIADGYSNEWIGTMFKKGSIKTIYSPTGKVVEKTFYVDEFKGNLKVYSEETGKLILDCIQGMGDYYYGAYKAFYDDGKPKVSGQFVDNMRDGTWVFYKEDGSIDSSLKFRIHTKFHANKKIKVKGCEFQSMSEWIRDGTWIFYDEKGRIDKTEKYKEGELIEIK